MTWSKVWVLAGVIVIALTAFAIGKGSKSNTVVLCADKNGGDLTLASHGKCDKGSKSLKIAKRGPTGPAGPAGTQGANGQNGQDGQDGSVASVQPESAHAIADAVVLCDQQPGAYCRTGSPGQCYSWGNAAAPNPAGAYLKDAEGFVHLQGAARDDHGGGACLTPLPIFYLPAGYRPVGETRTFIVAMCDDSAGIVTVAATGAVSFGLNPTFSCVNLDGITFHADA